ncbi:MAG: hypothetical protein D6675_12715 [Gemmatimonadetes bacterium]|nr:MAG: hypothetical protein D6675_12715 [Gemmatimonadota bacterium]
MYPKTPSYHLTSTGDVVIENYNSAKLFASFFPGVAGKSGIPMWVFYVNRGQCVCSMGIEGKHHPIMEFLPANWAYQLVPSQGFRTFLKVQNQFYEPFQDHLRDKHMQRTQRLTIQPAHVILEEKNPTLGLNMTVEYFTIPNAEYAGLVRRLRIENITASKIAVEGLDGLPLIIPYGIDNFGLKNMRRLVEAFVEVTNLDHHVPFFKGKVEPADRPDVVRIQKGNFYVGFEVDGQIAPTLVDPEHIFGRRGNYDYPERFLMGAGDELLAGQMLENRLPCAMGLFQTTIDPHSCYTFTSIIGHAHSVAALNERIPRITKPAYIDTKLVENQELIDELTQHNFIFSNEPALNFYARQNFLDNVLRGGFPYTLTGKQGRSTLHLYSRKHGDLERDYNDFRLTPTPYSQGNGNFRDVNQNRRCDLFFNPDVGDGNVEQFVNLIQLDGFNPLVIKETRFTCPDANRLAAVLADYLEAGSVAEVRALLKEPFTPGELMIELNQREIHLNGDPEMFLGDLLGICQKHHDAEHGEGFWTDHWTYNLDLIENYLALYPEKKQHLLFEKKTFTFYDNAHRVQSRDDKYVIWEGKPMQLNAVVWDEEKEALLNKRASWRHQVRTDWGNGEVYQTTLFVKLLCLITNKLASLDPAGIGVEMEADKPNWYDALNGLPGLIGSSVSETLEIKRHILFLQAALDTLPPDTLFYIFEELELFMTRWYTLFRQDLSPYDFWDRATTAKEDYRQSTRFGIRGHESPVPISDIKAYLITALRIVNDGIDNAWNPENGVLSTYFINTVVDYEIITNEQGQVKHNENGLPCFRAKRFESRALPLFLEGPVHFLRCHPGTETSRKLIVNLRKSSLYDRHLKMFKVNESLAREPMEIGRARTFSPGWFENESIWLHMEYKYMLELLKNGFYTAFYHDFRHVFVPFFNPEIYGRSILENSSFIVSSANPDPSIHGNGFVARLSGATAEFINILMIMAVGQTPFQVHPDGALQLKLNPALPGWLFTTTSHTHRLKVGGTWQEVELSANTFSFMFLGSVLVVYHNPARKDTFGMGAVSPAEWIVVDQEDSVQTFQGDCLDGDIVTQIRNRSVKCIEIELR